MKLKLEHMAMYLPYKLKWTLQNLKIFTMSGITESTLYTKEGAVLCWQKHPDLPIALFPILKPLSDYKDINSPAMSDLNCDIFDQIRLSELANREIFYKGLPYGTAQICFKNHIDIFDLISDGLAINKNTLPK